MKKLFSITLLFFCFHAIAQTTYTDVMTRGGNPVNITASKSTPFAKPAPFGDILNVNLLPDLTLFGTPSGSVTIAQASNMVTITSTDIAWLNYVNILPNRPTILRNKSFSIDFRTTAQSATTSLFGIGLRSIIGPAAPYVYVNTTNTASKGNLTISTSLAALATGTGTPISLNEWATLTISYTDSSISASTYNWTTGLTSAPVTYNFTVASATLPSLCNFSIVSFCNNVSTQQVRGMRISSNSLKNGNTLLIGDSKTQGYFANYWATRYGAQLANQYNFVDFWAGGSLQAGHLNAYLSSEFLAMNYRNVIFNIGCNDIRAGTTLFDLTNTLNGLFKTLQSGGVKVAFTVMPEDSTGGGVGLTLLKNWAASGASLATYIDSWTPMSSGNKLLSIYNNGDGIHPNQAGNNVMDSIIVASAFIKNIDTTGSTRYRATDNLINQTGDSLSINLKVNPVPNTMPVFGPTGNVINAGIITQAGTSLNVQGSIQLFGSTATMAFNKRNDQNPLHSFQLVNLADKLSFFDSQNGRNSMTLDTTGRMQVGSPQATTGNGYIVTHQSTVNNYAMIILPGSVPSGSTDGGIYYDSLYSVDSKPHFIGNIKGVNYVLDNATGGSSFITSLTNTGTSGAATVTSGVLNIPTPINISTSAFTPNLTATTNVGTTFAGQGIFFKVGSNHHVGASGSFNPTATGLTVLTVDLPATHPTSYSAGTILPGSVTLIQDATGTPSFVAGVAQVVSATQIKITYVCTNVGTTGTGFQLQIDY